jgi:hypothetical protein
VYSTRVKGAWNVALIYKKHGYIKNYALAFPFPLLHSQEACVLSKNDLDTWYRLLAFRQRVVHKAVQCSSFSRHVIYDHL